MTRQEFLDEYKAELITRYDWARNRPNQLVTFMHSVTRTLDAPRAAYWICEGDAVQLVWAKLGGVGKVTIAKLRKLPTNSPAPKGDTAHEVA